MDESSPIATTMENLDIDIYNDYYLIRYNNKSKNIKN